MEFDPVLIAPRRAAMVAQRHWRDRTINDALDEAVQRCGDKVALKAVSLDRGATRTFTYRELAALADRIAVGMARLGIGRDDVVSCQLPNGWEFTLVTLACARIGAVMNPLMHIFREPELSFMLAHGRSKLAIVPRRYRGFDFEAMLRALQPSLPDLEHVLVVGGEGPDSFEARLAAPAWEHEADAAQILARSRPHADDVMQLIYTSGTTGEPKGVMHTANTALSNLVPYAERLRLGAADVVLMASPMAHQTGFLYGLMMPIVLQARTVAASGKAVPSLRIFLCAGAPIPGPLVEQARAALGAKIVSAWGMTENGAVTTTLLDDADELSVTTDGCPLPGMEVRIAEPNGRPLADGTVGNLLVRGCSNFGGYLKRPQLNATDADGWFDTGDLAVRDAHGYIRISGRSKDVIIRGGENIPVVEIEALLYRHPAVAQVAIVGFADERLGERACAVVVTKAGQSLDFAGLVDFLKTQKVALQYIPERLIVLDAMPATPSGKIQKFKLRELVKGAAT